MSKGEEMQDFDEFWKVYPRKIAKADARKAWKQTESIRPDLQTIIQAVEAACKTEQWMRGGGQFIPYPATWIRGERWEDCHEVKLPDVVNEKPWHESSTGIEAKGRELGLDPANFPHFPAFKTAVMRAVMKAA
jgi:alkylhydroperoxidase/carboxymuconolactone decarboxylase family protein YurZ